MIVVFTGPSLPPKEAKTLLPEGSIVLPPAEQGDLLTAVRAYSPKAIGLIDGLWGSVMPVWHKEIMTAISEGILVYGSSSMGALRAAECADFGMIPVGKIAAAFRDGKLVSDSEVVLAHAGEEDDFKPLSLPMVNVRWTIANLLNMGLISKEEANREILHLKRIFYPDRTFKSVSDPIRKAFREHYVDQKRSDAVELCEAIASFRGQPKNPKESQNYFHAGLEWSDRRFTPEGQRIYQIVQALPKEFEDMCWLKSVADEFALSLGIGGDTPPERLENLRQWWDASPSTVRTLQFAPFLLASQGKMD